MSIKVLRKEELNKNIAVIIGTRPGIVKFAPVVKELERRRVDFFIIHAGQHYSYNMDDQFFEQLKLPKPKHVNDNVKNYKLHGEQTAEMIKGIEKVLLKEKPSVVIVGGDANTNLAGALAARKLGITLVHMEAGLRSNDWSMPEEHNRVMIDHISEVLLAPTKVARGNLKKDNVKGKIVIVGNPIVDAVTDHVKISKKSSQILDKLRLKPKKFFLLTFHREENVDSKKKVKAIIKVIKEVRKAFPYPIVFPVHPRTMKRIKFFGYMDEIKSIKGLKVIKAVGYLDFLKLLSNSAVVLTDSGGIQEECCILKIPCVTLRENTERPETVEVGANVIASASHKKVCNAIKMFLSKKANWKNPFGNNCAKKIVNVLVSQIKT